MGSGADDLNLPKGEAIVESGFHSGSSRVDFGDGVSFSELKSGNKYIKPIKGDINGMVDVYSVLVTFGVTCPARQHAIKKLLMAGLRGKGDVKQDLKEAIQAIERAVELC